MDRFNRTVATCKAYCLKMVNEAKNAPERTGEFDPSDVQQNTLMAVLSYVPWLFLIPFFCCKKSRYVRFHVNQGAVLTIGYAIVWAVLSILTKIPLIGLIFRLIRWLAHIVYLCAWVWGLINAMHSKAKELPLVNKVQIVK